MKKMLIVLLLAALLVLTTALADTDVTGTWFTTTNGVQTMLYLKPDGTYLLVTQLSNEIRGEWRYLAAQGAGVQLDDNGSKLFLNKEGDALWNLSDNSRFTREGFAPYGDLISVDESVTLSDVTGKAWRAEYMYSSSVWMVADDIGISVGMTVGEDELRIRLVEGGAEHVLHLTAIDGGWYNYTNGADYTVSMYVINAEKLLVDMKAADDETLGFVLRPEE